MPCQRALRLRGVGQADEAGAYVKAWVFVEYPTCGASLSIHECVRAVGHEGTHACHSECDLGHVCEDELGGPNACERAYGKTKYSLDC